MSCKWGHPVATLPSDGWDSTSLSLNYVNPANHHPFPGYEPTIPGFDLNHLAPTAPCRHVGRCSSGREQWRSRAPSAVS
eukprot:743168-Pleurochrysis_carterae.AAC.1